MKKLLVHLHIYYIEQIPELLQYMQNLQHIEHDLYITTPHDTKDIENKIKPTLPHAIIKQVENRGYDIGPFIDTLNNINLDNYKYVLKLHTKGKTSNNYTWLNNKRLDNALWGKILWDSMLLTEQRIDDNLAILDNNPNIGMLGSSYCYTNNPKDYNHLLPQINNELTKAQLSAAEKLSFIAGSMFLAKAKLFKLLQTYNITDFAPTDGKIKEGTFAHVVERLFGALITIQNHTIHTSKHDDYCYRFLCMAIKRFLFQKKITKSGKQIIKICKIPVYSKKRDVA